MAGIELIDIHKTYRVDNREIPVLNGINLSLPAGRITVILGQSGCGKTTLLRLTGGLETADSGEIRWESAHKTAFVFQEPRLMPWLTVWENVVFGLSKKETDPGKIEAVIRTVGLSGFEKAYPAQLSGGMQQRAAIARALAYEPTFIMMDEPFAALDAKVRTELRSWLKEMVVKLGITSIFVTHDQEEAVEVADEIIITNHGTIEQMGTPVEIYKSPATPFVARFIGRSSVVEDYDKLKGFERIEHANQAVIRPEFVKISKSGKLDQYISAAETGVVTDVVFRGNRMDVTVDINGILVVGERSLEKDFVSVGETVHVLIYRLYIFDSKQTYLMENKEMQEREDVFYI